MDPKIRRVHPPAFKSKVAVEALKEQKIIAELSSFFGIHETQITKWKKQALEILTLGFSGNREQKTKDNRELIQELYRQIGRLKVEVDFLKKRWASWNSREHILVRDIVSYINKTYEVLPLGVQAELLGISRSSLYYEPQPVSAKTLLVMNRIDEVYTAHPFFGSRRIAHEIGVNRKQIQLLMRKMGLEAIYPKPNLSKNANQHPVYPYLLRGVTADHPNHIWGTDITYIRMHRGFLYLI